MGWISFTDPRKTDRLIDTGWYCWWFRNLAPVEGSGSLSHYLQGFLYHHPRWFSRRKFWTIKSSSSLFFSQQTSPCTTCLGFPNFPPPVSVPAVSLPLVVVAVLVVQLQPVVLQRHGWNDVVWASIRGSRPGAFEASGRGPNLWVPKWCGNLLLTPVPPCWRSRIFWLEFWWPCFGGLTWPKIEAKVRF